MVFEDLHVYITVALIFRNGCLNFRQKFSSSMATEADGTLLKAIFKA